jgi:hypothetical protein
MKFPVEMVIWDDHYSKDAWSEIVEHDNKAMRVTSIGFLIKEDDKAITLALNLGANDTVSCAMTILKTAIHERRKVRYAIQKGKKRIQVSERKEVHEEASATVPRHKRIQEEEK